jgi:hypothetical protein
MSEPPIIALPRGQTLPELFWELWPRLDPELARDAHAVLTETARAYGQAAPFGLPREGEPEGAQPAREAAALHAAWENDVVLDTREVGSFRRREVASVSGVDQEYLMLEVRVRRVLRTIADEVRAGRLLWTANDPSGRRCTPDAGVLEHLEVLLGSHRWRNQIPTPGGIYRFLRFSDAGSDPAQLKLELSLPEQQAAGDTATVVSITKVTPAPEAPPAPEGIAPERWGMLWALYDERVRAVQAAEKRRSKIKEDLGWRVSDEVKNGPTGMITRPEVRALRQTWGELYGKM